MGGVNPDGYTYEHHLIYYLVDCQTNCGAGVNEISANTFQLGDAFPNPTNCGSELVIPFDLNSSTEKVSLKIYNSIGQIIQNYDYKNYMQGEYKTVVSTSDLNAGLYFYSLETNDGRATKSFTIAN